MPESLRWIPLPDPRIQLAGLPWALEHAPHLWRLPAARLPDLPEGVRRQAIYPAGGRIRCVTDAATLAVRVRGVGAAAGQPGGLDLYVDGAFWHTVAVADGDAEVACFQNVPARTRRIDLYLPVRQEIEVLGLGLPEDARLAPPPSPERSPIVLYGSSVAQGAGASRPGMGYGSICGRQLDIDVVNLGFGGAGRAEAEVVDLVASLDACAFLLDLGKSYGRQTVQPYVDMLARLRRVHPDTPILCLTPIHATREAHEGDYADLSQHTRQIVRDAVEARRSAGDPRLHLVEGTELLGPDDADGLSRDGVHPGDLGFQRIADRLVPHLRHVLQP